jgi:hypothetical protein
MGLIPRIGIAIAASVALLAGAAAPAQGDHSHSRNTNLMGVRTYAFREATIPATSEKSSTCDTPLVRDDTNAVIAAQLDRFGLKRDDTHPDVYVVARRTFEREYTYYGPFIETSAPDASFRHVPSCRSGWVAWNDWDSWNSWNGFNGGVYADLYARLTVDLEDAASGASLWRGSDKKRVSQSLNPHTHLYRQVAEVFEHFPVPGAVATTGVR